MIITMITITMITITIIIIIIDYYKSLVHRIVVTLVLPIAFTPKKRRRRRS